MRAHLLHAERFCSSSTVSCLVADSCCTNAATRLQQRCKLLKLLVLHQRCNETAAKLGWKAAAPTLQRGAMKRASENETLTRLLGDGAVSYQALQRFLKKIKEGDTAFVFLFCRSLQV